MYNIYTTEGIIIKIRESGEADKIFSVFTKDFGRVEIFAKGARNGKSKLNPHLALFNHSRVSFISGRDFFRLTDALKISSLKELCGNLAKLQTLGRIFNILEKMLQGQEKNEELWRILLNALNFLTEMTPPSEILNLPINKLSKNEFSSFEAIFLFKIMHILGYIDDSNDISLKISEINEFNEKTIKKYENLETRIFKTVNYGIKASGMV